LKFKVIIAAKFVADLMLTSENLVCAEFASEIWLTREKYPVLPKQVGKQKGRGFYAW
jgi:hypothetical protein